MSKKLLESLTRYMIVSELCRIWRFNGAWMPDLMFSTKYCSMFSWNSGSMKVASARDLISGSDTRRGSMAGTWGIRPFSRVRDMVRKSVQGQTSVSDIRLEVGWSSLERDSIM